MSRIALVLLATLVFAACDEGEKRPLNLLLVSVDTLRADHLSSYGYERPTSPATDRFLEQSVVFDDAHVNSSWTLSALASIMTSLYPATHRCLNLDSSLSNSFTTLADALQLRGYATHGISSQTFLLPRFGLQQGFASFDNDLSPKGERRIQRTITSDILTDKATMWIALRARQQDPAPWFLWVHYFDPHTDYLVHEGISEKFGTRAPVDVYDGEIAFTDLHLARLWKALEKLDLLDDTVVVFVSDHGEEFREHGSSGHGRTLYREVLHVPFAVRAPGYAPMRVANTVQGVDVFPTVAELLEVPAPDPAHGRSLVPLMRGESLPEVPAFAQIRWKQYAHVAWLQGRWKLIWKRPYQTREIGTFALYDRLADPDEQRDLAGKYPERVTELRASVQKALRAAVDLKNDFRPSRKLELGAEEIEALRSLGYVE